MKYTFSLLFLLIVGSLIAQNNYQIAFYNVENLFDLTDDKVTHDEEFTPTGKKKWTKDRYTKKLDHLAKVLGEMGAPEFIGLAEVENNKVVNDLEKTGVLKSLGYKCVHEESPDFRGIDVAFMYQKDAFKVTHSETIRIPFPSYIVEEEYTSRDILHITGQLTKSGETLHFFINHWPSRRGGLAKSEPKRLHVAHYLKTAVEDVFTQDANANIIIMGDFNDEPANSSVLSVLGALPNTSKPLPGLLYNMFYSLDEEKKGTYNYKGNWNMLDQIIVSGSLFDSSNNTTISYPVIFQRDWMMYTSKKYGKTPSRTYGGPNYYGGYSDHLPISVLLSVK